jgi:tartrate dehydrogenase/decarboxylase/D-malate dehydrogenase
LDGPDEQVSLGHGNINPERNFPFMFEPIHGLAFDIVGIERVTADQPFPYAAIGGKARTAEVTAAVIEAIRGANT